MFLRFDSRACLGLAVLVCASVGGLVARADPPTKAAVAVPMGALDVKDWLKASTTPLQPGEIDRLIGEQLTNAGIKPAPRAGDELFLRRVYLDLTGTLPMPADIREFLADKLLDKRARIIDKLLDSDEYAEYWSLYWRNVIASKVSDFKGLFGTRGFDLWMTAQLKANRSWGEITRELLTAGGTIDLDEPEKNGQAWFLSTRFGMDAPTELAAETSRIFLGIQIQCAQCHDHPSDVWKRRQFHEFAAYFARTREQPIFDKEKKRFTGIKLISLPFAEHQMPDKADPKKGTIVHPTFLDGKSPGQRLSDDKRRAALAASITAKDNPWFAAAFVNRIWGTLLGQSFYQPIDDLGPLKEAAMPEVIARLAGAFRGNGYDVKQFFRDVMNSETYQRDMRTGRARPRSTCCWRAVFRCAWTPIRCGTCSAARSAKWGRGSCPRGRPVRLTALPGWKASVQAGIRLRPVGQGGGNRREHRPVAAADEQLPGESEGARRGDQSAGTHFVGVSEECRCAGDGLLAYAGAASSREGGGPLRTAHPTCRHPRRGIRGHPVGAAELDGISDETVTTACA